MSTDVPRRRNGLDRPYSTAQIAASIAMVVSILQYATVVAPILRPMAIVPVTLIFAWTVGTVLHSAMCTILIDPIDVYLCRHIHQQQKRNEMNGVHNASASTCIPTSSVVYRNPMYRPAITSNQGISNSSKPTILDRLYHRTNAYRQSLPLPAANEETHGDTMSGNNNPMKHCWICDVTVSAPSMHCKFCNKCVANFDHHCMWLNTCVGQANYTYFFRTLLSLCAMQIVHFSVQLYLVIDILIQGPSRVDMSWIQIHALILVVLFVFLIFNCFSLALIGQLIVFHLSLQRNNLTTYEYIIRDHQAKRLLARREGDIEAHRVVRMAEAQLDGRRLYVRRLQLGGLCRQMGLTLFDPLDIPDPPPEPNPEDGFANILGHTGSHMANGHDNTNDDDEHDNDAQRSYRSGMSSAGVYDHPTNLLDDHKEERYHENSDNRIHSESVEVVPSSSDQELVDHMFDAGASMLSIHGRVNEDDDDDDEDPDDPSNGGHDDSLGDTDDGSPIKETNISSPIRDESSSSGGRHRGDDEEEDEEDGIEADVFDNEPDDVSYTSGCSGKSGGRGNTSTTGERDYTAF